MKAAKANWAAFFNGIGAHHVFERSQASATLTK